MLLSTPESANGPEPDSCTRCWLWPKTIPIRPFGLIEQLAKDGPDAENEPVLYSTAAYTAIKKDDFGSATDVWGRSKSMYAALNRWQALSQKRNVGLVPIGLFKAQFWLIANRPDLAWAELEPFARQESRTEAVLAQLIQIALNSTDDEKVRMALNYVAAIRELKAKAPNANLVATDILEAKLLDRRDDAGDAKRAVVILQEILSKQPSQFEVYSNSDPDLEQSQTGQTVRILGKEMARTTAGQSPDDSRGNSAGPGGGTNREG